MAASGVTTAPSGRRQFVINHQDNLRVVNVTGTTYNYTYLGNSVPGMLSSDRAWFIKRIRKDNNTGDILVSYAETYDGAVDEYLFNKVWNDYASYYYEEG